MANNDGKITKTGLDEMEIFTWNKDFKKQHKGLAEFEEKEKRVFPIVLGEFFPSLISQLEGGKGFEKICKNSNMIADQRILR